MREQDTNSEVFSDCTYDGDCNRSRSLVCASCQFNKRCNNILESIKTKCTCSDDPRDIACKHCLKVVEDKNTDIYNRVIDSVNTHQVANDMQIGGDHYKNMKITPTEYIVANDIPWRDGNAIKYISRHRFKNGKEDIKKAIHYLQLILENEYAD